MVGSLAAHRDYYLNRAQLWERQALTKARLVAGNPRLGAKYMRWLSEYVYTAPITPDMVAEIRRMRNRIETERGNPNHPELEFKTGTGGLIDVEFLVQTLQLRYGQPHPQLRNPRTLTVLNRLASLSLVEEGDAAALRANYLWLRRIESTLRRAENTSVSALPVEERQQTQLAKRLHYADRVTLIKAYEQTTRQIRTSYDRLMTP